MPRNPRRFLLLILISSIIHDKCSEAVALERQLNPDPATTDVEVDHVTTVESIVERRYANSPNGAACLGNLDCASGCCIVQYDYGGVCVVRARVGQICGLLTFVALGPPGYFHFDPEYDNWRRKRR